MFIRFLSEADGCERTSQANRSNEPARKRRMRGGVRERGYSCRPLRSSSCPQFRHRPDVPELVRVDDRAHALDPAVGDVERHHADHALLAVQQERARLAVDLDPADRGAGDPRALPHPGHAACAPRASGRAALGRAPAPCRRRRRAARRRRRAAPRARRGRPPGRRRRSAGRARRAARARPRSAAGPPRRAGAPAPRAGGCCPRSCRRSRRSRRSRSRTRRAAAAPRAARATGSRAGRGRRARASRPSRPGAPGRRPGPRRSGSGSHSPT